MAEGGHLQENTPGNDKASSSPCRLLDCPICLEQMLQPKSLPCLHSFCEDCLGTYIVTDLSGEMAAATSFPCPVCRKITSPVDPSESKETWARQFPANNIVQSLLQTSTDSAVYCGPCRKMKNLETSAKLFCETNNMLLCEACKENYHDVIHVDCDIVSISEASRGLLQKQHIHTCSTHNENIEWYCEDHSFLGCNKCIITDHRHCEKLTMAKEYCEKQQKKNQLNGMKGSLRRVLKYMESARKYLDDKDAAMKHCKENGLKSISDLRQRINAHLDRKQEEITQELISKYKAEKTNTDVFRQNIRRLEAVVQNTTSASSVATQRGDHVEMIQLFNRGETEVQACNDLIDEISSSKSVTIKHDMDRNLVTIDPSSPLSLGKIFVEEQPCTLPGGVRCIQKKLLCNSLIWNLRKFKINVPSDDTRHCYVHGVVLMSNGDIVISDSLNMYLKLFSHQGKCLNALKIRGYPHDVCLIDNCTVAVAVSSGSKGIQVVKVQNSLLTPITVLKTPRYYYGITFLDQKFIVSTKEDIYRLSMKGENAEKICQLPKECTQLASCSNENCIFASMFTSRTNGIMVTRLSSGKQKCVLRAGLVKGGKGIDVDRESNLYVCGYESNNVVQVSADGTQVRELLTSKDGIDRPGAISVCENKFVVVNKGQNELHVYQLY
ncbi:uncharacterized protein [Argopecten irradians]|uniref:uncharacterized protein n=1 Tax=Argopecten irradians TaxID=31199 RepID=UPI003720C432